MLETRIAFLKSADFRNLHKTQTQNKPNIQTDRSTNSNHQSVIELPYQEVPIKYCFSVVYNLELY